MDNPQQQFTVPVEAWAPLVAEQRNQALDEAAQWKALAVQFKAERDQLADELAQLRAGANVS
ncbi:hypothetical protein [Nonomuraea jabiensis]|uniref:hypothetical protein n=1 Tax=Nonomuraea jabiensis TaxID=882448 RepID=UPI00369878D0